MHGHLSAVSPAAAQRAGRVRQPQWATSLAFSPPSPTDAVLTMQRSIGNAATSRQRPVRLQRQISGIAEDAGTRAEEEAAARYNQQRLGGGHQFLCHHLAAGDPLRLVRVIRSHQKRNSRPATGHADQEWVEGALKVFATISGLLVEPHSTGIIALLCSWMSLPRDAVTWVTTDAKLTCENAPSGVAVSCPPNQPKPLVRICQLPSDEAEYLAFAEALWKATVLIPHECARSKPDS